MEKELNEEELTDVNGGQGNYREPTPEELETINRMKKEMQSTRKCMEKANPPAIMAVLQRIYEQSVSDLRAFIATNHIDPSYQF